MLNSRSELSLINQVSGGLCRQKWEEILAWMMFDSRVCANTRRRVVWTALKQPFSSTINHHILGFNKCDTSGLNNCRFMSFVFCSLHFGVHRWSVFSVVFLIVWPVKYCFAVIYSAFTLKLLAKLLKILMFPGLWSTLHEFWALWVVCVWCCRLTKGPVGKFIWHRRGPRILSPQRDMNFSCFRPQFPYELASLKIQNKCQGENVEVSRWRRQKKRGQSVSWYRLTF